MSKSPGPHIRQTERSLSKEEIDNYTLIHIARDLASHMEGIVMSSEVITWDIEFGFIVRYNIVNNVEHDGKFHSEDSMKGKIYTVKSIVVFYSDESGNCTVEYHPQIDLPIVN